MLVIKFIKNNKLAITLGLLGFMLPAGIIKYVIYQTDYLNRGVRREIEIVKSRIKKSKNDINNNK